jgi:predicted nucleic acid-binding protein
MPKVPPHVAVDANFLLNLADGDDVCLDALETLKKKKADLLVTPTVLAELGYAITDEPNTDKGALSAIALGSLRKWGITPIVFPTGSKEDARYVEDEIRANGLIPHQERNDSLILAEAVVWNCDIVLSGDKHIADVEREPLGELLKRIYPAGTCPVCVRPQMIRRIFR